MIGKINPAGGSFKSAVEYSIRARDTQERKHNAVILCSNMGTLNSKEIIEDFQEQTKLNSKVSKPIFHAFLSFHKDDTEKLDKNILMRIVQDYTKEMRLTNTQFVAFLHTDTQHPHLHLIANRVTNNGTRYNDSMEGFRGKQACQRITAKYQLTPADHLNNKHGLDDKIIKGTKYDLNPKENFKKRIKPIIQQLVKESKSLEVFKDKMKEMGFDMKIKQDANGQNVGVSFGEQYENGTSIWMKGSEIDRQLSAKNLTNLIEDKYEYESQNVDNEIIEQNFMEDFEELDNTFFNGIISEDGSSIKAMIEELKARNKDKAISRAMNRKFRKKL